MRERPERILDTGHAGPNGRRGVVVRYPHSQDYFRRLLARVGADQTAVPAADDPAAKLLSMVQCILAPIREADFRGGQLHRAAVMRWAAKNPHMFDEHFGCCTSRAIARELAVGGVSSRVGTISWRRAGKRPAS